MILLMLIVGLFCCGYVVAAYMHGETITKIVIFTIAGWIMLYILVCGGLLWINLFSVKKSVFACMIACGLARAFCILKERTIRISFDIKKEIPAVIIVLITLPLILSKYEFYGMGQDQGVYQTQAILFMNGVTDLTIDLDAWYPTEDPEEIAKFEDATSSIPNLTGYYRYSSRTELPGIASKEISGENAGVLHGIPTFSALLALCGTLFGMENMQMINTIAFVCIIFLIFYICDALSLRLVGKVVAVSIYAISPIVIWTNKAALTETVFTLILVSYIYCILQCIQCKHLIRRYALGSALSIAALAFFHISVFVFMPLFGLIYLGLWFFYRKRDYLYALILSVMGYYLGFRMMYTTATQYTSDNYRVIYFGPINSSTICQAVALVCGIVTAFSLLFVAFGKNIPSIEIRPHKKSVSIVYKLFYIALICLALYRCIPSMTDIHQISNITLVSFMILCGLVVPTVVYVSVLVNTKWWLAKSDSLFFLILFTYCILIYAAVFQPWVAHYYYYTRYLTMFVPLLAIMGGMILNRVKSWKGILSVGLSGLILFPFDMCLMTEKDDSRIEWNTLTSIASEIDADDSLIIAENELFKFFYFPLKAMTGADIYPAYDEDLSDQISALSEKGGDVFVLTWSEEVEADEAALTIDIRLKNLNSEDYNSLTEDYLNSLHSEWLQLPFSFYTSEQTYTLFVLE